MRRAMAAIVAILILVSGELYSQTKKALPADVGPGRVAWFDITTTDLAQSKDFYGKLFDWQFNPVQGSNQTVEIVAGGTPIGTMRVADGKISGFNGVVYVQVSDIQASCKKATDLGGMTPPGFPFNLSDGRGAIALVVDPVGHPDGLYSRTLLPPRSPAKQRFRPARYETSAATGGEPARQGDER